MRPERDHEWRAGT